MNAINIAQKVFEIESKSIAALSGQLTDSFTKTCEHILSKVDGRVILTGIGKSGHIASKIAASLASTGTPSFFVHPSEASHGDLGMVTPKDTVIALSNSGEAHEILAIIPILKRMDVTLISITSNSNSSMAIQSDFVIEVKVEHEACPLNLAPTASTTATLAMGDALTVALLELRGFTANDFAMSHPGGSLGKRLLVYVEDVMHKGNEIPVVNHDVNIHEALVEISEKGLGMTGILDNDKQLVGIFTDGDLRRTLSNKVDIYTTPIEKVMTKEPATLSEGILAAEAVTIMQSNNINGFFVLSANNQVIGALNTLDLIKAGIF